MDQGQEHLASPEAFQAFYDSLHCSLAYDPKTWKYEWMKHFHPAEGRSILDLGCSSGRNVIHYARKGHRTYGIDVSLVAIGQFDLSLSNEPPEVQANVGMMCMPIEEWDSGINLSGYRFDYVLLTEVLEHVADPVKCLEVARKALAPNGEVYISVPARLDPGVDPGRLRGIKASDIAVWAAQAGLRVAWGKVHTNRVYAILNRRQTP